jgi:hypothetical protein
VASALPRRRRQVGVDVEKARAGEVAGEIELTAEPELPELPATVDELVLQIGLATARR